MRAQGERFSQRAPVEVRADRVAAGDVIRLPEYGIHDDLTIAGRSHSPLAGLLRFTFNELGPDKPLDLRPGELVQLVRISRT